MNDLHVVNEGSSDIVGAVVYGSYSGCNYFSLLEKWKEAGFDPNLLPNNTSPKVAVKRAIQELSNRSVLARPLGRGKGYALVNEEATGEDLNYNVELKVKLENDIALKFEPEDHVLKSRVQQEYSQHLMHISGSDISMWVKQLIFSMGGSRLRDRGGVYFLPHTNLENFRKMMEIVQDVSGSVVFELPVARSEEAVKSILHAITKEAEDHIGLIEGAVESEDDLGPRAMKTKARQCEEMIEKVERYENLLNASLEGLREKLGDLNASFTVAACMGMDIINEE